MTPVHPAGLSAHATQFLSSSEVEVCGFHLICRQPKSYVTQSPTNTNMWAPGGEIEIYRQVPAGAGIPDLTSCLQTLLVS